MIFVTGDTHGDYDLWKLNPKYMWGTEFLKQCKETDYLIICGDFGVIWNYKGADGIEKGLLDFLEAQPYTTLVVDGNHENHPRLQTFPEEIWNGGRIHRIREKVIHLMRGQVYTIDGKKIFTMGGATSIDKHYREEGKSWWPEEIPSNEEFQEALKNLDANDWKVDYVFTHCAPDSIHDQCIENYSLKNHDKVTNFLESIKDKLSFKKWYFGHYHIDKEIEPHFVAVYLKIKAVQE